MMNDNDLDFIKKKLETLPSNPKQHQRSELISEIRAEMLNRHPMPFYLIGEWHNEIIDIADKIKPDWRGYIVNKTLSK